MERLHASVLVLLVCLSPWSTLFANTDYPGKEKSVLCRQCHGDDGISEEPLIPKLAGQHKDYILKQVYDFQIANRRNKLMTPMSHAYNEHQDLVDIAVYFSSQKPMQGISYNSTAVKLGKRIFENGIPSRGILPCRQCHAPGSQVHNGNTLFPRIAGQHKRYLVKQLLDFRAQRRLSDASGMMHSVSKSMSKLEMNAVAEYVSGLHYPSAMP